MCSDERHRDENKSLVNTPQHGIQLFTAFTPLTSNSLILLFLCYVAEFQILMLAHAWCLTVKDMPPPLLRWSSGRCPCYALVCG